MGKGVDEKKKLSSWDWFLLNNQDLARDPLEVCNQSVVVFLSFRRENWIETSVAAIRRRIIGWLILPAGFFFSIIETPITTLSPSNSPADRSAINLRRTRDFSSTRATYGSPLAPGLDPKFDSLSKLLRESGANNKLQTELYRPKAESRFYSVELLMKLLMKFRGHEIWKDRNWEIRKLKNWRNYWKDGRAKIKIQNLLSPLWMACQVPKNSETGKSSEKVESGKCFVFEFYDVLTAGWRRCRARVCICIGGERGRHEWKGCATYACLKTWNAETVAPSVRGWLNVAVFPLCRILLMHINRWFHRTIFHKRYHVGHYRPVQMCVFVFFNSSSNNKSPIADYKSHVQNTRI